MERIVWKGGGSVGVEVSGVGSYVGLEVQYGKFEGKKGVVEEG